MLDIASRATWGIRLPSPKQSRSRIFTMFKQQVLSLQDRLRACSVHKYLLQVVASCRYLPSGRQRQVATQYLVYFSPERIYCLNKKMITLGSLHNVTMRHIAWSRKCNRKAFWVRVPVQLSRTSSCNSSACVHTLVFSNDSWKVHLSGQASEGCLYGCTCGSKCNNILCISLWEDSATYIKTLWATVDRGADYWAWCEVPQWTRDAEIRLQKATGCAWADWSTPQNAACFNIRTAGYFSKLRTERTVEPCISRAFSKKWGYNCQVSFHSSQVSWTLYFNVFNFLLWTSRDCGILHMMRTDSRDYSRDHGTVAL